MGKLAKVKTSLIEICLAEGDPSPPQNRYYDAKFLTVNTPNGDETIIAPDDTCLQAYSPSHPLQSDPSTMPVDIYKMLDHANAVMEHMELAAKINMRGFDPSWAKSVVEEFLPTFQDLGMLLTLEKKEVGGDPEEGESAAYFIRYEKW